MLTEDIVSSQDVFDYLGIDETDGMVTRRVESLREMAASYLNQAVGTHVEDTHPTARELALMVIADCYDSRGTTQRVTLQTRRMVQDFSQVLILEGRGDALRQEDSAPEEEP